MYSDLTEWRKKRGISLAAISAATKIGSRYLEAIELSDFKRLPGGVYGLNYVRQYARAIGYDEHELLDSYKSATPPEIAPQPAPQPRRKWFGRVRNVLIRASEAMILY